MTGVEAWTKMLTEGAKIRCTNWLDMIYIQLCGEDVKYYNGHLYDGRDAGINDKNWELYAEPTVTLAEAVACVMDGGIAETWIAGGLVRKVHLICTPYDSVVCVDGRAATVLETWPAQGWIITKRSDRT